MPRLEVFKLWLAQGFHLQHGADKPNEENSPVELKTIIGLYSEEYTWRVWREQLLRGWVSDGSGLAGTLEPLEDRDPQDPLCLPPRNTQFDANAGLHAILMGDAKTRWDIFPW